MNEFYLASEKHKAIGGQIVENKDLLYFRQPRSGYDGKATAEHVKNYPGEFERFKQANPNYVLPDTLVDVKIGDPLFTPQVGSPVKETHAPSAKEDAGKLEEVRASEEKSDSDVVAEQPEEPNLSKKGKKSH